VPSTYRILSSSEQKLCDQLCSRGRNVRFNESARIIEVTETVRTQPRFRLDQPQGINRQSKGSADSWPMPSSSARVD
jgi:hypothetical protein